MNLPNMQSVALPVPEIIATAVLGWGCEPPKTDPHFPVIIKRGILPVKILVYS